MKILSVWLPCTKLYFTTFRVQNLELALTIKFTISAIHIYNHGATCTRYQAHQDHNQDKVLINYLPLFLSVR